MFRFRTCLDFPGLSGKFFSLENAHYIGFLDQSVRDSVFLVSGIEVEISISETYDFTHSGIQRMKAVLYAAFPRTNCDDFASALFFVAHDFKDIRLLALDREH